MGFVKDLSASSSLTSIPSNYAFATTNPDDSSVITATRDEQIPTIDFSLLTSGSPDQRSQMVQDLGKACLDWGFFMVINHGVPESLSEEMLNLCLSFFDLSEEEKLAYAGKHVLNDPIRCGSSSNASEKTNVFFWRDFLKVIVHPKFHSLNKPQGFSEISYEYSKKSREIARELLKGISLSLGLEESYIEKATELQSGLQILGVNLYPPCPHPELAMGLPPHSDNGLLTLLIQNGVDGLQVKHNDKWVHVQALPNSILVNTGDHIEILSNGKYKSVYHRAVVNNKATRISLAMTHGPSLDAFVKPAVELVDSEHNPPAYHGMTYKEYLEIMQTSTHYGKACLDLLRVSNV